MKSKTSTQYFMRDLIYTEFKYCLISTFKAAITEKLFEGQKKC